MRGNGWIGDTEGKGHARSHTAAHLQVVIGGLQLRCRIAVIAAHECDGRSEAEHRHLQATRQCHRSLPETLRSI